ncbi:MAG: hypothetical protein GC159_01070 [Phycisphaera sp.]|nr:hypothetical protein [Phycisphaera sp.]
MHNLLKPDAIDAATDNPNELEKIAEVQMDAQDLWRDDDLKTILDEQLKMPLADMERILPNSGKKAERYAESTLPPLDTIGSALLHQQTPVELLKVIKSYAKVADRDPSEPIPQKVARVLYYASIASALVNQGALISSLATDRLTESLGARRRSAWITPKLCELFDLATKTLMNSGNNLLAAPASDQGGFQIAESNPSISAEELFAEVANDDKDDSDAIPMA